MTIEEQYESTFDEVLDSRVGPDRRDFLKKSFGVAGLAASVGILNACASDDDDAGTAASGDDGEEAAEPEEQEDVSLSQDGPEIEWDMATSWPAGLVTLFGSANVFAEQVGRLTGGKFKITARPAGEIVGGLEVLPAVRDQGVQSGHTASYYYTGLNEVQQFGTAVPFGLTQRQHNAWLYEGGGLDILNEFYAEEHGIITFPAGGTGCQMGGWFSKEINTVDDLQGLKMRIPGIAGQVLSNLGGEQVSLPGGEILPSIETGAIDAAEFVGPTDDLILGLDQFDGDLFYYHPGWWEPGTTLEVQFPLALWDDLPEEYQAAVEMAAAYAHATTVAKYDVLNAQDLKTIQEFATIVPFSPEIMAAFKTETESVLDGIAGSNAKFGEILGPWREYRDDVSAWHALAEKSFLNQQTDI
ncbi:MAG: twin-arginine translocation signal domain-containing protein [Actinomycetota bacterium]